MVFPMRRVTCACCVGRVANRLKVLEIGSILKTEFSSVLTAIQTLGRVTIGSFRRAPVVSPLSRSTGRRRAAYIIISHHLHSSRHRAVCATCAYSEPTVPFLDSGGAVIGAIWSLISAARKRSRF